MNTIKSAPFLQGVKNSAGAHLINHPEK